MKLLLLVAACCAALAWPAQAADKFQREMDALNLCMYTAGIRLFGIPVASMRKLVLSSCDGQIHDLASASSKAPQSDPGGPVYLPTDEDKKRFDWEDNNAAKMPMPKFAIDYFISDYGKALKRQ